jgi:hypothetical protein
MSNKKREPIREDRFPFAFSYRSLLAYRDRPLDITTLTWAFPDDQSMSRSLSH